MKMSDICPECGKSMEGKDKVAHAMSHWHVRPAEINTLDNEEAQKRYRELIGEKSSKKKGLFNKGGDE